MIGRYLLGSLNLLLVLHLSTYSPAFAQTQGFDEKWTGSFDGVWDSVTKSTGESKKMKFKVYFKGNDIVGMLVAFDDPSIVLAKFITKGNLLISLGSPFAKTEKDRKSIFYATRYLLDFITPDYKRFNGKKIKVAAMDGKKCEVFAYEILGATGRHKREDTICDGWFPAKVWFTDFMLPGLESTITLTHLKLGIEVKDDLYSIPPDYKPQMQTGHGSSPSDPMVTFRPLEGEGAKKLPELPAGLTYCQGAQLPTFDPTAAAGMSGMPAMGGGTQNINFTCPGLPSDVAAFYTQQLQNLGFKQSKKVEAMQKDAMKDMVRMARKAKIRSEREAARMIEDMDPKMGFYISAAPNLQILTCNFMPGFQEEGQARTSVMCLFTDYGKMNIPGASLEMMRKEFE